MGVLGSTASWTSDDKDATLSVAWGDVDGDGDLDLAAGNGNNSANKVYLNQNGVLQTAAYWTSNDSERTRSVAWGDVDGDGDLDLAAGSAGGANSNQPSKVYLNHNGVLETGAAWTSEGRDDIYSVAWGDVDGDGDLDLAVGDFGKANKVYLNHNGVLQTGTPWTSSHGDRTYSVAWGDVDGDGDLDLAVGNANFMGKKFGMNNYGSANKVYLNQNGVLQTAPYWISNDEDWTRSVAWGDVDGDGDLDLAVGNSRLTDDTGRSSANRVYLNQGLDANGDLSMTLGWSSDASYKTYSVAWGDVDGDGDLDLAVGNGGGVKKNNPNRVYLNQGLDANGDLSMTLGWSFDARDRTYSVAWGDVDGDGDLDLAAGNGNTSEGGKANKVYLNQGVDETGDLSMTLGWISADSDRTHSVAWGDMDGDGDLDLAVGNWSSANKVYLNQDGVLQTTAAWNSGDSDDTFSVAWGDADGDGDLDLAVGNGEFGGDDPGRVNKVYLNQDGDLQTAADNPWVSSDSDATHSVAWGDVDGDGDLDLAVGNLGKPTGGNSGFNKIYLKRSSRSATE